MCPLFFITGESKHNGCNFENTSTFKNLKWGGISSLIAKKAFLNFYESLFVRLRLKEILRRYADKTTGRKEDLVDRVLALRQPPAEDFVGAAVHRWKHITPNNEFQ